MQIIGFPDTISAREMQRGYTKVFKTVNKTQKPVVVMANNDPQAAIISVKMLNEYNQMKSDKKLFKLIDQIGAKNTDKNIDEVMADVTADVEEVRQGIYEKTFGGR